MCRTVRLTTLRSIFLQLLVLLPSVIGAASRAYVLLDHFCLGWHFHTFPMLPLLTYVTTKSKIYQHCTPLHSCHIGSHHAHIHLLQSFHSLVFLTCPSIALCNEKIGHQSKCGGHVKIPLERKFYTIVLFLDLLLLSMLRLPFTGFVPVTTSKSVERSFIKPNRRFLWSEHTTFKLWPNETLRWKQTRQHTGTHASKKVRAGYITPWGTREHMPVKKNSITNRANEL